MTCKNPIGFETLIAYWLGEVPEKSEAKLDEHLFGCAHCTRRLEELAALGVTQFNIYLMCGEEEETLKVYGEKILPKFRGKISVGKKAKGKKGK